MTLSTDMIAALREALPRLMDRDYAFAMSMLDQYDRRGSLSERQWPWVQKLVEKATPTPSMKEEKVDLSRLTDLFNRAAKNLKRPQVAFACSAGEFVVTRAGDNSRNPGYLYLKDVSKAYLGKISPEGAFSPSGWAQEEEQVVFEALAGFAADPAGAAAAYGKETGICCFCSRKLTDDRSVSVGYGPICASRFELPWG